MQNNISIDQKKQYLKSYRSTLWNIQLLEDEIHMFQSFSNTPSYIIHPVCGTQHLLITLLIVHRLIRRLRGYRQNVWHPSDIIGKSFSVFQQLKTPRSRHFFV